VDKKGGSDERLKYLLVSFPTADIITHFAALSLFTLWRNKRIEPRLES